MENQNQNNENKAELESHKEETKSSETSQNSQVIKPFLLGIGTLVILGGIFFVGFNVYAVKNLSTAPMVLKTASLLNLPVAKINGISIPYTEYVEEIKTLKNFYANAPENSIPYYSDEDVSDQVLSRLMGNIMIKELAKEFNVTVSEEEVTKFKDDFFAQNGGEEQVAAELQKQFGWTTEKYIQKIVRPQVLGQKVADAFKSGSAGDASKNYESGEEIKASHILFKVEDPKKETEVKKKAEGVLKRIKDGEDFAAMAKEFGSDGTKDVGGDLGWFTKDVMVPEFGDAVTAMTKGELRNELLKTQFGFHIIKVEDKRALKDFDTYFNDLMGKAKIELSTKVHDPLAKAKKAIEDAKALEAAQDVLPTENIEVETETPTNQ